MLTTIIATLSFIMPAAQSHTVNCPVMGGAVKEPAETIAYNGVLYGTCCAGCGGAFIKDPAKFLTAEKNKGKALGISMFDPVSGLKINSKKAKFGPAEYNGTLFYFAEEKSLKAFEAEPKKYGTMPEKEALYCPVMGHAVKGYAEAGGYADVEGVRYYVCCPDCLGEMKTNGAKHVAKAAKAVKAPVASMVKDTAKLFAEQKGDKKEGCAGCEGGGNCCGGS
jgi:YHS domain-containing protein